MRYWIYTAKTALVGGEVTTNGAMTAEIFPERDKLWNSIMDKIKADCPDREIIGLPSLLFMMEISKLDMDYWMKRRNLH
jgi:hypothetical protein